MVTNNYRVVFKKRRTGDRVYTGTYHDDGLSSLTSVTLDDGSTEYLSVLDEVLLRERIEGTPEGAFFLAGSSAERWSNA